MYNPLGYDPAVDFAPITQVGTYEFVAAVGPKAPVTTLKEFVDWAKTNPKDANYGIPGAGTLPHFLGALFARAANLDMSAITYRGGAPALTDLIGGQYPILFIGTTDVLEAHKGKQDPHSGKFGCQTLAVSARGTDVQGSRLRNSGQRLVRIIRASKYASRVHRADQQDRRRGDKGA